MVLSHHVESMQIPHHTRPRAGKDSTPEKQSLVKDRRLNCGLHGSSPTSADTRGTDTGAGITE